MIRQRRQSRRCWPSEDWTVSGGCKLQQLDRFHNVSIAWRTIGKLRTLAANLLPEKEKEATAPRMARMEKTLGKIILAGGLIMNY